MFEATQKKAEIKEFLLSAKNLQNQRVFIESLKIYDKLLQIDLQNEQILGGLSDCLKMYIDILIQTKEYQIVRNLVEQYESFSLDIDFGALLEQIKELEQIQEANNEYMKKVYELMETKNWTTLSNLDSREESQAFLDRVNEERYLYFPDQNNEQTGLGVGVYKYGTSHYFYFGDYSNAERIGNGTSFERNNADGFNLFIGEWRNDAPNGMGELTQNYYTSDEYSYYNIVTKGNYTNGLSDGYMNCVLTEALAGSYDLSYTVVNGTPEDITDAVHRLVYHYRAYNYIYAYDGWDDGDHSWCLFLNTKDDKVGVFGFEIKHVKSWKDAYIGYINAKIYDDSRLDKDYYTYKLIDINNDDTPELFIDYGTTAEGAVVCSFYNGSVIDQAIWTYGFSYIEGQNLLMDSGGHMDYYYDDIYSIDEGSFILLGEGECIREMQYDSDWNIVSEDYYWSWNGNAVSSEAEYMNLINEIYDSQKSISPYDGDRMCSYEEIIDVIKTY